MISLLDNVQLLQLFQDCTKETLRALIPTITRTIPINLLHGYDNNRAILQRGFLN